MSFERPVVNKVLTNSIITALMLCCTVQTTSACTTAVISGKATADGRPILWKNRDFSVTENEVVYFKDGKYPCLGLVNAGKRTSAWMGVNSAGLCMENSVSKDMAYPADVKGPGNGTFILTVLKSCATVEDVEALLQQTNKTGRSTCANFGVIDAKGGAVIFETGHNSYVKFDANDPNVAPDGYVVRSNFSMTGQHFSANPTTEEVSKIYSSDRYLRAKELVSNGIKNHQDVKYILRNCARDLACDGNACSGSINGIAGDLPDFIPTKNTISRTTTVSYVVFQGVKAGEDPRLTTMWIGLGDPKFSAAIPCWVASGVVSKDLQGEGGGPLCQATITLRSQFFDKEQDGIKTAGLKDVWSELWNYEDQTYAVVEGKLAQWRQKGVDTKSMAAIHLSSAEQALTTVSRLTKKVHPVRATTSVTGE